MAKLFSLLIKLYKQARVDHPNTCRLLVCDLCNLLEDIEACGEPPGYDEGKIP